MTTGFAAEDAWNTPTTTANNDSLFESKSAFKIDLVEITPAQVVQKEQLISEIQILQEGLRAILDRVTDVQNEGGKLRTDNEMLQTYIDNLTRNNALAAGAGK